MPLRLSWSRPNKHQICKDSRETIDPELLRAGGFLFAGFVGMMRPKKERSHGQQPA